jgi:hypothetical protein
MRYEPVLRENVLRVSGHTMPGWRSPYRLVPPCLAHRVAALWDIEAPQLPQNHSAEQQTRQGIHAFNAK